MDNTKQLESILRALLGGIPVTINGSDIQIGAVEIKNGSTDTRATVTAASTAAQSTDTSIVVAINPNTPLPTGTNSIGNIDTLSTLTSGNVGGFTTVVSSTVVMSVAGVYSTGDYMGTTTTPQSFANVTRTAGGGTGIIKSIMISDKLTTANVAMELWIIDRTFTAPTDNAAWDLSDANMLFVQAVIPLSTSNWYSSSAGQVYFDGTLNYPIKPNASNTVYYALVARGTTPSFTSQDLTITISVLQD